MSRAAALLGGPAAVITLAVLGGLPAAALIAMAVLTVAGVVCWAIADPGRAGRLAEVLRAWRGRR